MTFQTGTATDYIDLLEQMVEIATSDHVATAAVNAGGTGYAVDDILTVAGGTSTHVATLRVTAVSSGVISSVRIETGGAYTADPTLTANAVTGGTGSGATFDLTMVDTGWTRRRWSQEATSAAVTTGGTGYSVSDVLTVQGGVLNAQGVGAATFTVSAESGGVVTAVTLTSAGDYEVAPTGALVVTGGGGSGATLTPVFADKTTDIVTVLEGEAGGTGTDPLFGIHTYSDLDEAGIDTTYNWGAFGMTSYSDSLPLYQQPNVTDGYISDGSFATTGSNRGAWTPLKDSDAFDMDFWFSITGRRIIMVARIRSATTDYYVSNYYGLLNPFGTTTEVDYPMMVMGTSDRYPVWYRDTNSIFGGLTEPISRGFSGPGYAWVQSTGEWVTVANATISSDTDLTPGFGDNLVDETTVWPLGQQNNASDSDDQITTGAGGNGFDNIDLTLSTPVRVYRTPDTGGDLFPLFPATVVRANGSFPFQLLGEMDAIFWFSIAGESISSEDTLTQTGNRYTIFQNGTRLEPYSFFALLEE